MFSSINSVNTTIVFYTQDTDLNTYSRYDSAQYQISETGNYLISSRIRGAEFFEYAWSTSEDEPTSGWTNAVQENGYTTANEDEQMWTCSFWMVNIRCRKMTMYVNGDMSKG